MGDFQTYDEFFSPRRSPSCLLQLSHKSSSSCSFRLTRLHFAAVGAGVPLRERAPFPNRPMVLPTCHRKVRHLPNSKYVFDSFFSARRFFLSSIVVPQRRRRNAMLALMERRLFPLLPTKPCDASAAKLACPINRPTSSFHSSGLESDLTMRKTSQVEHKGLSTYLSCSVGHLIPLFYTPFFCISASRSKSFPLSSPFFPDFVPGRPLLSYIPPRLSL